MFDEENDAIRLHDVGVLTSSDAAAPVASASEPPSPLQARLLAIWREALEVSEIGVQDDFFDLGGNSISALRIVSRVIREFKVELTIDAIFDAPTIAGFATTIESALQGSYF